MNKDIKELDRMKNSIPIFHCWLYKWFGIETKKYKQWWNYYSKSINLLLKCNKIYS